MLVSWLGLLVFIQATQVHLLDRKRRSHFTPPLTAASRRSGSPDGKAKETMLCCMIGGDVTGIPHFCSKRVSYICTKPQSPHLNSAPKSGWQHTFKGVPGKGHSGHSQEWHSLWRAPRNSVGACLVIAVIEGDNAVKVLHSICQQIWKTQQWPQDWKSQFSFPSQRKAMPKNAQTTAQLHSSHMLVK